MIFIGNSKLVLIFVREVSIKGEGQNPKMCSQCHVTSTKIFSTHLARPSSFNAVHENATILVT